MTPPSEHREAGSIQHWMQAVVTDPGGVLAGVESDEARAEFDVTPESLERLINPSQSLTSRERLDVYAGAYYARLLECLREEFPALVHALGEETFNGFAFAYLEEYPSRSYTLANLAQDFPRHLAASRPPRESDAPDWADFFIDLATLERTYGEVFDCPGFEGRHTLRPEDLKAIPPEQWPDWRLVPVPCLRLLSLHFPVHEYAGAVRRGENPELPRPRPTRLVVTRREYVIRRFAAERIEFALLGELVAGATVGEAIAKIAESVDWNLPALAARLREWFEGWASAALFLRAERGDSPARAEGVP